MDIDALVRSAMAGYLAAPPPITIEYRRFPVNLGYDNAADWWDSEGKFRTCFVTDTEIDDEESEIYDVPRPSAAEDEIQLHLASSGFRSLLEVDKIISIRVAYLPPILRTDMMFFV